MTTINEESWNEPFKTNTIENDEIRDSDRASSTIPYGEYIPKDSDNGTLTDDDLEGRDLDTDGSDEWDEDDVSETDLDQDDLHDDDETMADIHAVKNDQFGSLGASISNAGQPESPTSEALSGFANTASAPSNITNESVDPNPDEIPEEHEADGEELDYPDDDRMEQANDDEVNYKESSEVDKPTETEAPKEATLDNLDPNFTENNHGRTSGRMIDHEPGSGSTMGDHGAYNL